jgi:hypothetical protein
VSSCSGYGLTSLNDFDLGKDDLVVVPKPPSTSPGALPPPSDVIVNPPVDDGSVAVNPPPADNVVLPPTDNTYVPPPPGGDVVVNPPSDDGYVPPPPGGGGGGGGSLPPPPSDSVVVNPPPPGDGGYVAPPSDSEVPAPPAPDAVVVVDGDDEGEEFCRGGDSNRILICHVPPGANAHSLLVPRSSWENGHSRHGDYLGECQDLAPGRKPKKHAVEDVAYDECAGEGGAN